VLQVVAATQQGVIRTWNTASGTAVKQINFRAEVTDKSAIALKGLEVFNYNGAQRILTISENGQSYCFNPDSADFEVQDASSDGYVTSYSVGSDTRAFHVDPVSQSQFIVGGKENDVSVWDMATQQKTFKCRNVCSPCDSLQFCSIL
jgi:WD40 repeat protein